MKYLVTALIVIAILLAIFSKDNRPVCEALAYDLSSELAGWNASNSSLEVDKKGEDGFSGTYTLNPEYIRALSGPGANRRDAVLTIVDILLDDLEAIKVPNTQSRYQEQGNDVTEWQVEKSGTNCDMAVFSRNWSRRVGVYIANPL